MSICATRAHYQPQNLAENDIKLSNFCQKGTKAPEDVKRIEIDRTDRCICLKLSTFFYLSTSQISLNHDIQSCQKVLFLLPKSLVFYQYRPIRKLNLSLLSVSPNKKKAYRLPTVNTSKTRYFSILV